MQDPRFAAPSTRRSFLLRTGATGATLALPGFLAACGGGDSKKSTAAGATATGRISQEDIDSLTVRLSASVPFLDIVKGWDDSAQRVVKNSLESLLRVEPDGKIVPALAESWEQPDPKTFVYRIREGVTFWDGSEMTADDVVWSLQRNSSKRSVINYYFANLRDIRKTGPNEVTVRLKNQDVFFAYAASYVGGFVVSKRFGERAGNNLGRPGTGTMGTGPYKTPKRWNVDESITLERHSGYWDAENAGKIERLDFRVVSDPSAAALAFRSGELEAAVDIPTDEATHYERIRGLSVDYITSQSMVFWAFNTSVAPFDDVHVRRAWAHCCDTDAVIKGIFGGHAEKALAMTPPNQWAGLLSAEQALEQYKDLPQYLFDLELARKELAQSKVPDGFETTVRISNGKGDLQKVAQAVAQSLGEIGIKLNVREVPEDSYTADYTEHDVPIQLIQFGPDNNDPLNQQYYICDGRFAVEGQYNMSLYRDAEMDRLLKRYSTITDKADKVDTAFAVLRNQQTNLPHFTMIWTQVPIVLPNELRFVDATALSVSYGAWAARIRRAA